MDSDYLIYNSVNIEDSPKSKKYFFYTFIQIILIV